MSSSQKKMVSHFQEQKSLVQNSILDDLYCEEERFDEYSGLDIFDFNEIEEKHLPFLCESYFSWEDDEVVTLLIKEKDQAELRCHEINSDGFLGTGRKEAVKWMLKVIAHYGFTVTTGVLAVLCYDRFVSSPCFQKDKPWMSQLAAVACLSIAAKLEETQVPLLLDLQVEESKYVFEAKTIQRGELLVLSTLKWKVNLVTPLSFFDHFVRRFGLITNLHTEFLRSCESLILTIVTDCRFVHFLPSVIAAATMKYVIREVQPSVAPEYENQLVTVLKTSKDKVDACHTLILELMDDHNRRPCHKRKYNFILSSPSGVIDSYFSSDSSNDSWAYVSPGSSSPEPLFKRSRILNQHTVVASLSSNLPVGVTDHPH
ncbi:cyclin-D3-2-like isoform X1 [Primulina eburnea]|uniref:cyclin-D3-2-like isoform X1 n=1 Tax=Primulina eburnea TaxID=1245227 RepID=UPI003C6CBA7F